MSFANCTLHKRPGGEIIPDGTAFRNEAHFRYKADIFVPCGGRPEAINVGNVTRMWDAEGKPNVKYIVEVSIRTSCVILPSEQSVLTREITSFHRAPTCLLPSKPVWCLRKRVRLPCGVRDNGSPLSLMRLDYSLFQASYCSKMLLRTKEGSHRLPWRSWLVLD